MPIPENFNKWESLQSLISRVHNKEVREFFRDDLLDDDFTSSEGSVRNNLIMSDSQTALETIAQMLFFHLYTGKLEQLISDNFYGLPKTDLQNDYVFYPQILLKFEESYHDMKKTLKKHQKRLRVSLRWLEKGLHENITSVDIERLTHKIKTIFPESFTHDTGLFNFTYYEPEKYFNRVNVSATNKLEADKFLEKLLSVINIDFDSRYVKKSERLTKPDKYITVDNKKIKVDGDPVVGRVRLKKAVLMIHGSTKDYTLIERYF
jgi:hypothetical protein